MTADPLAELMASLAAAASAGGDETLALRQLLAGRPAGTGAETVARLWWTVAGERRAGTTLSVWGGKEPGRTVDLARLRFGQAPALAMATQPTTALAAARDSGVAVLALDGGWWGRLLAEPALKVFAALPGLASQGDIAALAVGREAPEPTGADVTFWVTDAGAAPGAIVGALGRDGVAAELLADGGGLRLFALAGFYQADDPRLARAPGRLSGVIGASPAPL